MALSFGVLLAFVCAATAVSTGARHGTYTAPKSTFEVYGRDLDGHHGHGHTHYTRASVKTWVPPKVFEVYDRDRGLSRRHGAMNVNVDTGADDRRAAVIDFVQNHGKGGGSGSSFTTEQAGDAEDMQWYSTWKGPHNSSVTYVRQQYAKIPVVNTLANVGMNGKGEVTSYSSSFVPMKKASSFAAGSGGGGYNTTPKLTPAEASARALKELGGRRDDKIEPKLNFFAAEDGLKLTHAVRLRLDNGHLVDAYINAEDGQMHGLVDYTFALNMRVVPFQDKDITEGYELLSDVEDFGASPHGWMASGNVGLRPDATSGNNVIVVAALKGFEDASIEKLDAAALNSSSPGVFDYPVNLDADPSSTKNRRAAEANVFYLTNMAHDLLFRYGFTSDAFNFEMVSDANGGMDPVIASVQANNDDRDNAFMTTSPDQQLSHMTLLLWTPKNASQPLIDCSFDNSIVLHEFAHGLTGRMTGGGTAQCLNSVEAAGMGEGWSDAFANWVWQTKQTEFMDMTVGDYAGDSKGGIRTFPYSTNKTTNPHTFSELKDLEEPHAVGEIWAQALHNVHANLVHDFGRAHDALTNRTATTDTPSSCPCEPTFLDARNAWILADKNRYDGAHLCSIWAGFAHIGLGFGATPAFKNSFRVPKKCSAPAPADPSLATPSPAKHQIAAVQQPAADDQFVVYHRPKVLPLAWPVPNA
ncbi:Fungalysin metallopeptidase-domain-containing protein [Auriculariales sp. MPI-PUGE-AT-0066]|nr:Fungalysin metallopeptidase-domain-containing protein [Auriculariales sp. MPI-PUGE-AT-0066]